MPASCAKALAPTTALLGATSAPVISVSIRLDGNKCSRRILVVTPKLSLRTASATAISSSAAFPARSPMPLMVHSICRTPARTAASEFATAIPKSSWQCALSVMPSTSPRDARTLRNISPYSSGTAYPTVSGKFKMVAPASTATRQTWHKKSMSVRPASSAENSTSPTLLRPSLTIAPMASRAWSRVMCSFTRRCKSEVARKICSRGAAADSSASIAAFTSSLRARASAAIGTVRTSCATLRTASRSPREEMGNPASITSTPNAASWCAMRIFSAVFIEKPGDCSPSRRVVSKMRTTSIERPLLSNAPAQPLVKFIFILLLIKFPYTEFRGCPVDLGELQVFLTVAREGSFSRAAERLYRTQPAVSLAIRKLEDGLGQPLFVRGSRPVRMTDAGTLLKDYAERLINLRDEVKKGLTELEGLERGELSLGVNESSIHPLLPALAIFPSKNPAGE